MKEVFSVVPKSCPSCTSCLNFSAPRGTILAILNRMDHRMDQLINQLSRLANTSQEQALIAAAVKALDDRYGLSRKIEREPGVEEIIKQLFGRLYKAYGELSRIKGQRILDIACGSNTSKAPSFVFIDTPFGEKKIEIGHVEGYTAQFEPWFCRILLELDAQPVGVDIGDLEAEAFEHYPVDLGQAGALDFLPERSFDAVQDSRLFGSPEFTTQFPDQADRLRIAQEIVRQEQRLLKEGGVVIHSDAGR